MVAIRVRDNGVGIVRDILPNVFDIFIQADRSLERSHGGLGIGLTLVRRLVELHGGTVEAHSEGRGQGSEFVVRLPVLQPTASLSSVDTRSVSTLATPRRILIVDDNQDSASSLALLLSITGNETRTAHDGVEAVDVAARFKPDIVLLDIGLPKMNGYDACRAIRQQPGGQDMLLVAVTGWGQEDDRRRSQLAGFDVHLVKPVEYAEIEALLSSPKGALRN
jgi:CheY-like chemotaxis protein